MEKFSTANRVLAIMVTAVFLVSCSAPLSRPTEKAAQPTPAPTLLPASAAIAETPPAPTDTPPPKGLQHPLPSPTPAPTIRPADAKLEAGDYYPVWQNGREGVVDRNGNVVIPFNFVEISSESFDQDSQSYCGKAMFLCTPVQVGAAGARRRTSGYLYSADGKMVTSARLSSASVVGPDLVEIQKAVYTDYIGGADEYDDEDDGDTPPTPAENNVNGAILYSGKLVIPYQYMEIYQFGKAAAAVKMLSDTRADVDFYDLKGKLLQTMPTLIETDEYGTVTSAVLSSGNCLILRGMDGKYGILNDQLQWITPEEWDNIEPGLDDQFIVQKVDIAGVMDGKGSMVIPCAYQVVTDAERSSEKHIDYTLDQYYTLRDGDGIHIFDSDGRERMRLQNCGYLQYSNGVMIAQRTYWQNDVYDMQGNLLISLPDNIDGYYPDAGYFEGYNNFYNTNGESIPLSNGSAQCVTANRFIASRSSDADSNLCGLCDAQGNWIVQPTYRSLTYIGGNVLVYEVSMDDDYYNPDTEDNNMFGLMDLDGKVLTAPIFYEFDNYGENELYHVDTATETGLMDSNLHWVWESSVYNDLGGD